MSIMQKIRGYMGQQLLQNTAGFNVIRASGRTGPWVKEGEELALIPVGIQEVQFPVDVMGSDSIMAQVQTSVIFTYALGAERFFNFAYDVVSSRHTGNYADVAKKAIMNALAPKVVAASGDKVITDMVKETTLTLPEGTLCDGIKIASVQLSVKPRDANVMACLGATKTEELLRSANAARQETRMQAIEEAAELRTAEHEEAMNAAAEAELLIAERAKNDLAEAVATAAAQTELANQKAAALKAMVLSFGSDAMAYALAELASSGNNVTVTTELLAALRAKV